MEHQTQDMLKTAAVPADIDSLEAFLDGFEDFLPDCFSEEALSNKELEPFASNTDSNDISKEEKHDSLEVEPEREPLIEPEPEMLIPEQSQSSTAGSLGEDNISDLDSLLPDLQSEASEEPEPDCESDIDKMVSQLVSEEAAQEVSIEVAAADSAIPDIFNNAALDDIFPELAAKGTKRKRESEAFQPRVRNRKGSKVWTAEELKVLFEVFRDLISASPSLTQIGKEFRKRRLSQGPVPIPRTGVSPGSKLQKLLGKYSNNWQNYLDEEIRTKSAQQLAEFIQGVKTNCFSL